MSRYTGETTMAPSRNSVAAAAPNAMLNLGVRYIRLTELARGLQRAVC